MNIKRRISIGTLLISLMVVLVLVGCSNQQSSSASEPTSDEDTDVPQTETSDSQDANSEYPIVIEHAFGETVIESKPERVATIQWGNHTVPLALGVVPVGFSAANYGDQNGDGLMPWTTEKLKELGVEQPNIFQDTDGLDFEAISDTNPDVILAAYSGITQEDYEILSKIAPVVVYNNGPWATKWRDLVRLNAAGMGMKAEGEQLIKDTENLIKEKLSEYPQIQGTKIAWVNFSAKDMSEMHLYTPADPRVAFLIEELGMVYPESITKEITDPTSFSLGLSAENADILNDADVIIGYGDESLSQAVKADPLLGTIPAIQRGSVVFIDNGPLAASLNPNPLSIEYTIDEYLDLIKGAIDKVDE